MDYEKLATGLLARYRDCEAATRPIDKRLTLAHFKGMCEGAHRLPPLKGPHMDWLTHLYLYGEVTLRLDVANARPAFTNPSDYEE